MKYIINVVIILNVAFYIQNYVEKLTAFSIYIRTYIEYLNQIKISHKTKTQI